MRPFLCFREIKESGVLDFKTGEQSRLLTVELPLSPLASGFLAAITFAIPVQDFDADRAAVFVNRKVIEGLELTEARRLCPPWRLPKLCPLHSPSGRRSRKQRPTAGSRGCLRAAA